MYGIEFRVEMDVWGKGERKSAVLTMKRPVSAGKSFCSRSMTRAGLMNK